MGAVSWLSKALGNGELTTAQDGTFRIPLTVPSDLLITDRCLVTVRVSVTDLNGETHEVRWDRRYTGVMVGPQGRFYLGSKPDRGIYALSKIGFGLFRESFDISCGEYSLEEQRRQSDAIKQARQAAEAAGQSYSQPEWIWSEWKDAGNEKSDFKYAVGAGLGLGVQWWFGKNSQWGFDINSIYKYVYSSVDNENHSMWEWFLGPGLPIDLNASLVYRF